MAESTPSTEEWSRLYQAAIRVRKLAPWEWMSEEIIFGVENPETKELGFVSVMGMLGQHYSIALYLGARGLYGFWDIVEAIETGSDEGEGILQIRHLQASFEDRDQLTDEDRTLMGALGLKFRGRGAWPMFRSYRAGFFPWYLEAQEARFLTHALEQVEDVAPRRRENPALLDVGSDEQYLVRVPRPEGSGLTWHDQITVVSRPESPSISIIMDAKALQALKRLPKSALKLEVDLAPFPSGIGKKGERPLMAYALMAVEATNGFILGTELLTAEPTLETMWGQVAMRLVRQLVQVKIAPGQINVRSPLLGMLLQPLAMELRCKIIQTPSLPGLEQARQAMMQWLRR